MMTTPPACSAAPRPQRQPSTLGGLLTLILLATPLSCVNLDDPVLQHLPQAGTLPEGAGTYCAGALAQEPSSLRIHFIDVGQGDAIWIQTPDDDDDGNGLMEGYNILIDAGKAGSGEVITNYLTRYGLGPGSRIDFLIITHAHFDHYGGAAEILDNYRVHDILDPGFDNSANSTYFAYLDAAEDEVAETGGQFHRPLVGTLFSDEYETSSLFGSEIELTLLNSEADLRLGDQSYNQINNTSIAFSLEYAGVPVLLMGDVETASEAEIITDLPDLSASILKIGHHGSTTSTSLEFLQVIFANTPERRRFTIIESGTEQFGGSTLPNPNVVSRILEFVPEENYFATNNGDDPESEESSANDDHIQALITAGGDVSVCYVP